jgi:CRP-like cAMP-binding protein
MYMDQTMRERVKSVLQVPLKSRSYQDMRFLADAVRRVKVFRDLAPKERLEVTKILTFNAFNAGHHLVRDKARMNTFHLVLSGIIRIDAYRRLSKNGELVAPVLEEKEAGPGTVLGGQSKKKLKATGCSEENRRIADFAAECLTETECLSFEWDDFKHLFHAEAEVLQERKVSTLKSMGAFSVMSQTHIQALAEKFHVASHARNHVLAHTNEACQKIFIIMSGECKGLLKDGNQFKEIVSIGKGEVFGEVTDDICNFLDFTILSASIVDLMWIPREVFLDPKQIPTSVVQELGRSYKFVMNFLKKRYLDLKAHIEEPSNENDSKSDAKFFISAQFFKTFDKADQAKMRSFQKDMLNCHPFFNNAHPSGKLVRPSSPVLAIAPVSYNDYFQKGQKNADNFFFNKDVIKYNHTPKHSETLDGCFDTQRPRSAPMRRRSHTESVPEMETQVNQAQTAIMSDLARPRTCNDRLAQTAPTAAITLNLGRPRTSNGRLAQTAPTAAVIPDLARPRTSNSRSAQTAPTADLMFDLTRPITSNGHDWASATVPANFKLSKQNILSLDGVHCATTVNELQMTDDIIFAEPNTPINTLKYTASSPSLCPLLGSGAFPSKIKEITQEESTAQFSNSRNLSEMYAKTPQPSVRNFSASKSSINFISRNLDLVYRESVDSNIAGGLQFCQTCLNFRNFFIQILTLTCT